MLTYLSMLRLLCAARLEIILLVIPDIELTMTLTAD